MTIQEIINILQKIALTQPNVRSVGEGDIYDTLNAEASTKYAYFFITQNRHQQTEDTDRYSLNIFYIDRLTDDKSNKLQIQSIGKEVLGNVFNTFCEEFDIEVPTIEYQVFTERFSDYCAGVYATVAFEVMRETECADLYDGKYGQYIPVKIINQTKQVKFTSNGIYDITYDKEYTGLENVEVDVDVDVTQYIEQGRQEGYNDGYAQGETDGYGQGYTNGYSEGETKGYDNGYSNGYSEGETEGINQGIKQGITQGIEQGREQVRNEAEDLYLTNNGVYEGQNLYKRVEVAVDIEAEYNKGYEAGANAASANAIVLDVNSNGTVYTKFANIPEWTEPATGDGEFYSYAYMKGTSFNTGYVGDENTVIEIWYQPTSESVNNGCIVGKQPVYGGEIDKIFKINKSSSNKFSVEYGGKSHTFTLNDDEWYHLKLSYADGLVVNGEQITTFNNPVAYSDVTFYINSNSADQKCVNGYFGMVKIDDNVYIPTDVGFINRNTGEPLKVYTSGKYTFYPVEKPAQLDNLIKQVNVNVPIKAYDEKTEVNMSFQYSDMTAIPNNINFKGKTNWYRCFEQCTNLKDITALRNIKINAAEYMFNYCRSLTDLSVADTWDFSDCTAMNNMFNSTNIVDLSVTSHWNTSKVKNMGSIMNPSKLVTVGTLDCTSLNDSYTNSPMYFASEKLENVGGFLNIKTSLNNNYASPARCPNLTKESYINIFNGLYDFTGNGVTPNRNQGNIKLHSNAYNFLTDDDIAICTRKGWVVS